MDREAREAEILTAILSGNVPLSVRSMSGISVALRGADGHAHEATYFVMHDYLSVGSDEDFVRFPVTPHTAIAICEAAGCEMITTKISDDIFAAAALRLEPRPLTVDRDKVSAFAAHHAVIQQQLGTSKPGQLVVGIKKDIVLSNRLMEKPNRVAIYGWHHRDGRPIQPLYVGHVDWYVDYSHALRLMSNQMIVDGQRASVRDILRDAQLHPLLSREGPIDVLELRKASRW
jgi:hypothetical protein